MYTYNVIIWKKELPLATNNDIAISHERETDLLKDKQASFLCQLIVFGVES